jgi:hypothetical protein
MSDPFITTNGVTDSGRIYRGGSSQTPSTASSPDGLPSNYLLGAASGPSAFDTAINFDTQFGSIGEIGGFKFTSLALLGTPASLSITGGPSNIAFIAVGGIKDSVAGTSGASNDVFDLTGLDSVLFATQNGSITLDRGTTFQNSGTATSPGLTLYARGGTLDLEASTTFNLAGSEIDLYSDSSITDNALVSASLRVRMMSGGDISVGGNITATDNFFANTTTSGGATAGGDFTQTTASTILADTVTITATGALTVNGTINGTNGAGSGGMTLTAGNGMTLAGFLTTNNTLKATTNSGDINQTGGTIQAGYTELTSAGAITLNGTTNTTDNFFSASSGTTTVNGTITSGADTAINTDDFSLPAAGTVQSNTLEIGAGGTLTLSGTVTTTNAGDVAGDVSLTSVGALNITGSASITTAGSLTLLASNGNIDLASGNTLLFTNSNGALTATATNGSLTFDSAIGGDGDGYPSGITGTAGNGITVTANGYLTTAASGAGISLTATGGDFMANSGSEIQSGAGDVTLAANNGAVTLAGDLSSAGAATVTSNGKLTLSGTLESVGDAMLTSNNGVVAVSGSITTTGDSDTGMGGDVTLTSSSDLNILAPATITTNGSLTLLANAGDIDLVSGNTLLFTNSNGALTATATSGSLTFDSAIGGDGDSYPNAIKGTAGSGIIVTDNGYLTTAASGNGISLTATGGDFAANSGSEIQSGSGDITLAANNGAVTLAGDVNSAGAATVTSNGKLTLSGTLESVGDAMLTSNNGVVAVSGSITTTGDPELDGGGDVTLTSGSDLNIMPTATITITGSLTLLSNNGDINLASGSALLFTNSNGALTATATNGSLTFDSALGGGDGNGYPDGITGTAGNGITVTANGNLTTAPSDNNIDLTANGGIFRAASGSVIVSNGGDVNFNANNGAMMLAGTISSVGNISLFSSDDMTLTGMINASASFNATAYSTLVTGTGVQGDTSSITAGGQIQFYSASDTTLNDAVTSTSNTLSATSNGALTINGALSAATGATLTAYGGDLAVNGSVTVTDSNTGTPSPLFLVAPNGNLTINGPVSNGSSTDPSGVTGFAAGGTFSTGTHAAGTPLISANDVSINAVGGTAGNSFAAGDVTLDLTAFAPIDTFAPSSLTVNGASITASGTDTSGVLAGYDSVALNAVGAISLSGDVAITSLTTTNPDTAGLPGYVSLAAGATLSLSKLIAAGDVTLADGSTFTLSANDSASSVGTAANRANFITTGAPTVVLENRLNVSGNVGVSAETDTPIYNLNMVGASGPSPRLIVGGAVDLGAGSVTGTAGSDLAANGPLQTNGNVSVQDLSGGGGITIGGNLTVQTLSTNLLSVNNNPPVLNTSTVTNVVGTISPFVPGGTVTFTTGEFGSAGGFQFYGTTTNVNASSLVLNVYSNITFGPDASASTVNVTDFAGSGGTPGGGNGGNFTVNTFANAAAGTNGDIAIQTNGSDAATPLLTAAGGSFDNTSNTGAAGNGGQLLLTAAGQINVQSGANLMATGGNIFSQSEDDGSIAGPRGAGGRLAGEGPTDAAGNGGTISLVAGSSLTVGETTDTVLVIADGGAYVSSADSGPGGNGGAITLQAAGPVSVVDATVSATGGESYNSTGGSGGTINVVSTGTAAAGTSVSLSGASLVATTGSSNEAEFGGLGGTINIISHDAAVPTGNAPAILIDDTVVQASSDEGDGSGGVSSQTGGTINVTSARTAGAGIAVQNGSQLVVDTSFISAQQTPAPQGGIVNLTTSGASITVDNATINAGGPNSLINATTGTTGGTINVTGGSTLSTADSTGIFWAGSTVFLNTGSAAATLPSTINLTGANLSADVLKIQALGTVGQITIGGGTLSGNTQLLLYAGDTHSTGLIEFTANTTLSSNATVVLAAGTVEIDAGKTVNYTGSAVDVYTNNPEYDTGSYGSFSSSSGQGTVTTAPLGSAPAPAGLKGRVVGTWNVGGHRITAISTPVRKTPAGASPAPARKLASLANITRPGGRRAGKMGADRQGGRENNPPSLQSLRPALAVQR